MNDTSNRDPRPAREKHCAETFVQLEYLKKYMNESRTMTPPTTQVAECSSLQTSPLIFGN